MKLFHRNTPSIRKVIFLSDQIIGIVVFVLDFTRG